MMTAVAYPNFGSNNVTISTALFTFYLPAGTQTTNDIPVLPAFGSFTDITGAWRIEKITPALYSSFGFPAADLQGNDIYQCILQNSPSPNTTIGVPVNLFSFRLPADCIGGDVQVHINDNAIQLALLNNVGININNQMSISVNDAPSIDLYFGNDPATDNYDCPLDDVPVAVDDLATTNEDVAVTINVTGNDSFGTDGPSGGTITIITGASNGVAVVDNNGTPNNPADDRIVYTPNANYNGTDVVVYQICDADNDCDQATVNITITPVNDAPVVPNPTVTTPEDTPIPVCVPITDVDNSSFTVTSLCAPDGGVVTGLTNPSTTQYCLTYTPNLNFNGPDTLCILVCDGAGGCDTSYVIITVTPVNDPPIANDDNVTTPEDTPLTFNVTNNDTDVDGMINQASLDLDPIAPGIQTTFTVAGGTFVYNGAGSVTFMPNLNFTGTATVTYLVCDNGTPLPAQCDQAVITVTVTPVNDAPVVPNTTVTTPEDTPVTVCVPITDVDNNSFTVTSFCAPDGGVVSGLTNPSTTQYCLTYTPNANYTGPDTLCILICDGAGGCDTSYVFINVTPTNDPPSSPNVTVTTPEDTPILICSPITDVDNASFTVTSLCAPDGGVVSGLTNPSTTQYCLTYTPNLNFNGPDTLCILVCDGAGGCDTSYVFISVTPVNDPPIANDDNVTTPEDTPLTFNVTNNDTDVDGMINQASLDLDPIAPGIQTTFTVAGGTFVYNGAGSVTFTPNLNFTGTATVTYLVCDNGTPLPAQCDQAVITVTVTPVNDAPVVPNTTVTTPEDTPVMVCVPITDVDNNSFTVTSFCAPDGGVVSGLTNPATTQYCLTYTPNANYTGPDTLCILICDGAGGCDTSYVFINVTPTNDPPSSPNVTVTTPEDTPILICSPITDVDNASFTVTSLCAPDGGVVSGLTNPSTTQYCLTYTPNLNFNGPDTLCILVCDGAGGCDTSYVFISVTPVNDPPIANDDNVTTPEDTPLTFNVTNNDTDVDGMINQASLDLDPIAPGIQTTFTVAGGTFVYNGAGNVTFTPNLNFTGTATVTYLVCDNGTPLPAQCDQAVITVTVTPVNDAPVVPNTTVTTPEDTPVTVCVPITDVDNNSFTVTSFCTPDAGTISGLTNPATTQYCLTYTPNANYTGPDTLCILICDGAGGCDTSYVFINVTPTNDPPSSPNVTVTTPEDTPILICSPITDMDNASFTVTSLCAPDGGVVSGLTNPSTTQYCLTYTPNLNFNGPDTLCILVCDGAGGCDTSYVFISVTPVNDPPVANNDGAITPEDTPITFNITNNDTDVDGAISLSSVDLDPVTAGIQITRTVAGGMFSYDGAGNVTFTPNLNFTGSASTQYQVCDTGTPLPSLCDTATITVTVNAVNDPPVANDDNVSTSEDTPITFNVTNNDTDSDGAIDQASLDLDPIAPGIQTTFTVAGGTFNYNGAGSVTFTPNLNFTGIATAQYRVCDTGTPLPAQCDLATITVTVNAVNDPPVANDDAAMTNEDTPVTFSLTGNDTDLDGAIDQASLDLDLGTPGIQTTFTVAGGTFNYNGAGSVTFTPNANFSGTATAQYLVCDTGTPLPALCDAANITVTVNAVNDPPVANDDMATTPEDTPVTFNVTNNDTDVDGTLNLASLDLDPITPGIQTTFTVAGQGTFVRDGAGNVTFTPILNFNGTVTAQYQICDNGTPLPAQCDVATITVIVTAVNDGPIANNDSATTPEDTPVTVPVLNNDTDVDGTINPATVVVTDAPNHGSATVNLVTGAITYTPNLNFVGNDTLVYSVCDSGTPVLCDDAQVVITVTATSVRLLAKMRLQGSMYNTPDTLMRDNLRSLARIPKKEPYTAIAGFVHTGGGGGEVLTDSALVLANYWANSIVDWVFIELRNPNNISQVVATRSALLQRDGDVVDVDGVSALVFESRMPGFYYVVVRHRNHLGAMTANTIAMTNAGTVVDFTNLATPLWDDGTNLNGFEQTTISGKFALWAGNVNTNTSVVFAGQNNDKDPLFNQIDQAPGNIFRSQSYVYNGYHLGDVNMDGKAIFAGQTNDVDFIFNNVDGHPRNVTRSQSYVIRQQLAP